MAGIFASPNEYRLQIYLSLLFIFSVIGCLASLLIILVISKMRPMTSHVYLIFFMSVYQFVFCAFFFFKDGTTGKSVRIFATSICIFCGIATSFISNWIAYAMFSTVIYRKKFDVYQHLRTVHSLYLIPSLAISILYILSNLGPNLSTILIAYIYEFIRFGSIAVNFILVIGTTFYIRKIYGQNANRPSNADIAISTLCQRMMFYPIIQVIGRLGSAWYDIDYGLDYSNSHPSNTRYASMLLMAIVTPLVSVGYLFVFILMQPNAWKYLRMILGFDALLPDKAATVVSGPRSTLFSGFSLSKSVDTRSMTSEGSMLRGQYASTLDDEALESELTFSSGSNNGIYELRPSAMHSSIGHGSIFLQDNNSYSNVPRIPTINSVAEASVETINVGNPLRNAAKPSITQK